MEDVRNNKKEIRHGDMLLKCGELCHGTFIIELVREGSGLYICE